MENVLRKNFKEIDLDQKCHRLDFCVSNFSQFSQILTNERNWRKKSKQFGKIYALIKLGN